MTTELSHTQGPANARPTPAGADDGPRGTGSGGTRALGLAALVGVVLMVILGLVATEPDAELGQTVRILYIHVPVVTTAYIGIMITTVASVIFLWKKSLWWDLVAASAAELGAVFTALTVMSGMLWGKPTWGTYWEWDARITSTAILFLIMLGYLAVRRTTTDPISRGKRSAIVGILLFPNMIIVNRSVEWWRSLHQDATLFRPDPQIANLQMFTLTFGIVVCLVIFAWLMVHRFRLAWLQEQVDDALLDSAIAERRAEARPGTAREGAGSTAREGAGSTAREGAGSTAREGAGSTPTPAGTAVDGDPTLTEEASR